MATAILFILSFKCFCFFTTVTTDATFVAVGRHVTIRYEIIGMNDFWLNHHTIVTIKTFFKSDTYHYPKTVAELQDF